LKAQPTNDQVEIILSAKHDLRFALPCQISQRSVHFVAPTGRETASKFDHILNFCASRAHASTIRESLACKNGMFVNANYHLGRYSVRRSSEGQNTKI